jgi:uncharacterized RDD family membrane protein YckC
MNEADPTPKTDAAATPALAEPPPLVDLAKKSPGEITRGAGFGIRLLARLIDLIFGVIAGFVVGVGAGIFFAIMAHLGRAPENWVELVRQNSFSAYVFGPIGAFLYHSFAEGIGGATLGKLLCGLRVVSTGGGRIDLEAGLKRDLAYHWDALFFGLIAYTRMEKNALRQRYGDAWADTVVVKTSTFTPVNPAGPARIFLGILVGTFLWMAMTTLDLLLKVF